MDKRILILIAVFIIGSASFFACRKLYYKPGKIDYEISPRTDIKTGDSISYKDKTPGASRWKWDFGDGECSIEPSGKHAYLTPGDYNVILTAYGPFGTQTTSAVVNVVERDILPSGPPILGPSEVRSGISASWESSVQAGEYIWTVEGDAAFAGNIQKGRYGTYVFKSSGHRTLVLRTHDPEGVTRHNISVLGAESPAQRVAPTAAPPKITRPRPENRTPQEDPNSGFDDLERDKNNKK